MCFTAVINASIHFIRIICSFNNCGSKIFPLVRLHTNSIVRMKQRQPPAASESIFVTGFFFSLENVFLGTKGE